LERVERIVGAPSRIARLPRDRRGFPVPWFVAWRDGEPHFPVVDAAKLAAAWNHELCWVCGDRLGALRGWVVGPMSVIEGATPEPPSHHDCALFSVSHCPHLSNGAARYAARAPAAPGFAAQSNVSKLRSGAAAIWVTRGRGGRPFRAGAGTLFELGDPVRIEWYANGLAASRHEVQGALEIGLPTLRRAAEAEGRAAELARRLQWLERWLPAAAADRAD
jgi:hypothetical protein